MGGSSGGLFGRRLDGEDDNDNVASCQVPGPRTGWGSMRTVHNYMSWANKNTYTNT